MCLRSFFGFAAPPLDRFANNRHERMRNANTDHVNPYHDPQKLLYRLAFYIASERVLACRSIQTKTLARRYFASKFYGGNFRDKTENPVHVLLMQALTELEAGRLPDENMQNDIEKAIQSFPAEMRQEIP